MKIRLKTEIRFYRTTMISKIVDQYSSNSCIPTSFCITFATRITKKIYLSFQLPSHSKYQLINKQVKMQCFYTPFL